MEETGTPEVRSSEISQEEINSGKVMAILAYIPFFFIGLIIAIVSIATKNNAYSLYHAKQALVLYIIGACMMVILIIPFIGWAVFFLWGIFALVLLVLGIINASSGQCKPLPLIGGFGEKWFSSIQKV
jgi:uncharacterized membrane protein